MRAFKFFRAEHLWLAGALILAAGLKVWLVAGVYVPFNSDEAVVALMARHILLGERPVFFYGQAYMGSLDAFLVAGAFKVIGQQVWAIRLVQGLLYLGVLLTTALLGKSAFGSWRVGSLGALIMAVPAVNVTLYTTASLGGYGEALLIGNLILLASMRIAVRLRGEHTSSPVWACLWLGFLIGLGLWAFGLTLVYSLPALLYLGWVLLSSRGKYPFRVILVAGLVLVVGFLLGSLPWWWYALQNGWSQLIRELSGSAIAGVEGLPWLLSTWQHLTSMLLLGSTVTLGFRPPWDVIWLGLPLLPFVLIFWLMTIVHIYRLVSKPGTNRLEQGLLISVMVILLAAFVFTPFGADPSGRYFLPLAVPLALFAASLILQARERIGNWAYGLLVLVMVYHLWGTVQSARQFPPGITTQFYPPARLDHRYDEQLIEFLHQHGEMRGYTNYWVSYPLAFLSEEELIFIPSLPYHPDFRYTARDDRYKPYGEEVLSSERVAYIVTNHPALEEYLRENFSTLGVTWEEWLIGDFRVFYSLSATVRPEQIGLGK